jgi:DNA-binding beta-propeller fold protein YncE
VWIADYGKVDRVIQINIKDFLDDPSDSLSSLNATIFEGNYDSPSSLSVRNAEDATVYIADMTDGGGEIERLIYAGNYYRGTPVSLGNERGPSKVRVADAGLVWVLNLDGSILYFPENNPSQQIPIGSYAFDYPHAMAIDQETGNVWIGDNGRHQVVEISSADSVIVTISGFSFVEDIVVNK